MLAGMRRLLCTFLAAAAAAGLSACSASSGGPAKQARPDRPVTSARTAYRRSDFRLSPDRQVVVVHLKIDGDGSYGDRLPLTAADRQLMLSLIECPAGHRKVFDTEFNSDEDRMSGTNTDKIAYCS